jgi:hypothetical protein
MLRQLSRFTILVAILSCVLSSCTKKEPAEPAASEAAVPATATVAATTGDSQTATDATAARTATDTTPEAAATTADAAATPKKLPVEEAWVCKPVFRMNTGDFSYPGTGKTKAAAIAAARNVCKQNHFGIAQQLAVCEHGGNPDNCRVSDNCRESGGGPSDVHHTNWCLARGYDGYDPSGEDNSCGGICFRDAALCGTKRPQDVC